MLDLPVRAAIADYVIIEETEVKAGMLVSFKNSKYQITATYQDDKAVGVIVDNPEVALNLVGHVNSYPIVSAGETSVLVSATEGAIGIGDYLSSSDKRGTAVRAKTPGFMVGQALEEFGLSEENDTGLIRVRLLMQGANIDGSKAPILPSTKRNAAYEWLRSAPGAWGMNRSLLMLFSSTIMLLFFLICFFVFGQRSINYVTILGHDPLLDKSSAISIAVSSLILAGMTLSGVMVVAAILTL